MDFLTRDITCTIHESLVSQRTPHARIDNSRRLFGLKTSKTHLKILKLLL